MVRSLSEKTPCRAVSSLAYVEMRSVLSRAIAGRRLRAARAPRVIAKFKAEWELLTEVRPVSDVLLLAGELAHEHRLRGYDAVQLASCLQLRLSTRFQDPMLFLCFDVDLNAAARKVGLSTFTSL